MSSEAGNVRMMSLRLGTVPPPDVAGVGPVRGFDHQVGVPKAAPHVPGEGVSRHLAQVTGAQGPDELQAHVGRHVLGILDGPSPGEVPLEGAGVALYAVQPGVYVRMTRPLLLDKGLELDRELKQFLTQDACF